MILLSEGFLGSLSNGLTKAARWVIPALAAYGAYKTYGYFDKNNIHSIKDVFSQNNPSDPATPEKTV